jgi:hypothetical protein
LDPPTSFLPHTDQGWTCPQNVLNGLGGTLTQRALRVRTNMLLVEVFFCGQKVVTYLPCKILNHDWSLHVLDRLPKLAQIPGK